MPNNPKSRIQNLVVQELDDEIMVYDLNNDKVYSLNETSAAIWGLCDGTRTIAEISRQMSEKLKMPVKDDYIWLALRDLQKENLLVDGFELDDKFAGMSRRQVIRKIGFSSMAALPVIYSLVAPTAITAQSGPVCMTCTRLWNRPPCATPGGCNTSSTNSTISTACSSGCVVCPQCTVPFGGSMCSSTCTMT
jgi:Coenzyme PQQ synthesis protein D (PqqD)